MELHTRRLMLTLGGSLVLSIGVLAACSSDSGFTALPGSTTAVDAGKKASTADSGDDGNGEDQDAGTTDAGCAIVRTAARQYCFGARAVDDAGSGCSVADDTHPEVCCADEKIGSTFTPAKCARTTATASNGYATGQCFDTTVDGGGREWHCLEARHCPETASQCCVIKGSGTGKPTATVDSNVAKRCNQFYNAGAATFVGGTRCESACATGELHLCGGDDECDPGESCYYFTLGKHFTGVCKTTL